MHMTIKLTGGNLVPMSCNFFRPWFTYICTKLECLLD